VCAVGIGCSGPQYYTPPVEQLPPPTNVNGSTVQFIDQRPEWEKKPFTGVVCLYHTGKAHPDAWAQLAQEADAVVGALPQKPERVEVVVTSFRLVRIVEGTGGKFHDWGPAPNANPNMRTNTPTASQTNDYRDRQVSQSGGMTNPSQPRPSADGPANKLEMMFSSKDDPRRMLQEHPSGASCKLQATVRLVYPGGQVQTVNVDTLNRDGNSSGTAYWGEATNGAARAAVFQFGRQFRAGVGLPADG
jgi:hypothetical protein